MKAIIQNHYGNEDTLKLVEVERPKIKDNEILVQTKFANIASGDMRINTLGVHPILRPLLRLVFGWNGPRKKVRGISGSGTIVEIGNQVKNRSVGDDIYYINSMSAGTMGQYLALKEKSILAKVPNEFSLSQSAPLAFGALSAIHFINEKTVSQDMEVLIYGASGSVGTYAIQLAKYYGAKVTAVSSKKNHEILLQLGADFVIDYKQEDFTKLDKKYDLVFDTVMKVKKSHVKRVLTNKGRYLSTAAPTKESVDRLLLINQIIEKGKLTSYIEKEYKLTEYKIAHKHVYSKHKVGNVIMKMD